MCKNNCCLQNKPSKNIHGKFAKSACRSNIEILEKRVGTLKIKVGRSFTFDNVISVDLAALPRSSPLDHCTLFSSSTSLQAVLDSSREI